MLRLSLSRARCGCLLAIACGLPARAGAEPTSVAVGRPLVRVANVYEEIPGQTEPLESSERRSRVAGDVVSVHVRMGAAVQQGTLLLEIDSRPFAIELEKAQAEVQRLDARLQRAIVEVERMRELGVRQAASREDLIKVEADRAEAEAMLRAARAQVEQAKLNVDYTRITSPIAGRVGRIAVSPGTTVAAGDALVSIASLDPMAVGFELDEAAFARVLRARQAPATILPADSPAPGVNLGRPLGDRELTAFVVLQATPDRSIRARLDALGNTFDAESGTIHGRAIFPNFDQSVLFGMKAAVRLMSGDTREALFVATRAIVKNGESRLVWTLDAGNALQPREVRLGIGNEGLTEVRSGLAAEDWIVVEPTSGLEPGQVVEPVRGEMPQQAPPPPPQRGLRRRFPPIPFGDDD